MPPRTAADGVFRRVLGLLVTLTSVGAGAIGVTVLPRSTHAAGEALVGSDIAHAVPLTLVGRLGHLGLGNVDAGILVALLVGSIPGISARRAARRPCAGMAAQADPRGDAVLRGLGDVQRGIGGEARHGVRASPPSPIAERYALNDQPTDVDLGMRVLGSRRFGSADSGSPPFRSRHSPCRRH